LIISSASDTSTNGSASKRYLLTSIFEDENTEKIKFLSSFEIFFKKSLFVSKFVKNINTHLNNNLK
jgi:hypothetical protein